MKYEIAYMISLNSLVEMMSNLVLSDKVFIFSINAIHMYSGITSGRVLDGEHLYTKILEVNLFAFTYRLFHRDFSPIKGTR